LPGRKPDPPNRRHHRAARVLTMEMICGLREATILPAPPSFLALQHAPAFPYS